MNPSSLGAGMAWLGALAYTMQIYFDFSGYSDMAIGLGRMFGFHFLENFNYPYTATSIATFWRKWHISLSSWFRDYVYIPMGGNRLGNVYVNLLTVFFLTGMWHGASWNFIVWGMWHGFFQLVERTLRTKNIRIPAPKALKWVYTMLVVVIGWVFFRAADLTAAMDYLKCMVGLNGIQWTTMWYTLEDYAVFFAVGVVCSLPIISKAKQFIKEKDSAVIAVSAECVAVIGSAILLLLGIAFTVTSTYNPFIYFNF